MLNVVSEAKREKRERALRSEVMRKQPLSERKMPDDATPSGGGPTDDEAVVILVAPNVSEQLGGEAIKALHIYLELERQGVAVHQITHIRSKPELDRIYPGMKVTYVGERWVELALYRMRAFEQFLNLVFLVSGVQAARKLAREHPGAVVHFTSPVSPVLPYPRLDGVPVVIGPVNGNIHYPEGFRRQEPLLYKLHRWLHPVLQWIHRRTLSGKRRADAMLVAGGQRTYDSLRMAGCQEERLLESLDSGVLQRVYELPRAEQRGRNLRFVHNGRLVRHKGADLAIRSLRQTRNRIELDVIGRGPELKRLKQMARELALEDRVRFVEWIPDHRRLAEMLREYRGFVFPSLAEANGIVVQEAMAQGIPVVALDWGGPSLLVTPETGILIEPRSEGYVITELAAAMDRLAEDGELAEQMSVRARQRAVDEGYLWEGIVRRWRSVYGRVRAGRASRA